jgi:hypothetical protein
MKITVTDDSGNVRMERDPADVIIPPPPGWDEARWTGKLVEDLVRQLERERVNA